MKNKHNEELGSEIERSDDRIDITGEVFTPIELCNSMIDEISEENLQPSESFMDKYFKTKEVEQRDILFVFAGQVGCSNSLYVKNIIKEAYEKRDFDIVMISWRG